MALFPCSECGRSISDKAFACPQCGAPTGKGSVGPAGFYRGYEWKSRATLLGLPLVHVAGGWDEQGRRRVAKGIVAIGDIAMGALAVGGVALGGLTIGGASVGLVSLGGAAVGILLGAGGFAVGYVALGGLAIGYYALGGLAIGAHALGGNVQDPQAIEFFQRYLGTMLDEVNRRPGRY